MLSGQFDLGYVSGRGEAVLEGLTSGAEIGRRASGAVFKATTESDYEVADKRIQSGFASDPDSISRVTGECQVVVGRLRHKVVVETSNRPRIGFTVRALLVSVLLGASCSGVSTPDAADELTDQPAEAPISTTTLATTITTSDQRIDDPVADAYGSLTLHLPDESLESDPTVTLADLSSLPPTPGGAEPAGPILDVSAGGDQPSIPLVMEINESDIEATDPSLIFFARWDEASLRWIPYRTSRDASLETIRVEIDHLSLIAPFEWVGGQILEGLEWTGHQTRSAYDDASKHFASVTDELVDAVDLLGTNAAGWLGLRGASPPECNDPPNELIAVNLVSSAEGNQPPLYACSDSGDGNVVVKMANNRPYGMVVMLPPGWTASLGHWPDVSIASGQTGILAFHALLQSSLGLNETYIPPGATLNLTHTPSPGQSAHRLVAQSGPEYIGYDLAIEWALLIWGRGIKLPLSAFDCFLGGASSLVELVDVVDPTKLFVYADAARQCLSVFLGDAALETFNVIKSSFGSVPALLSNLKDLGGSGRVENTLTVEVTRQASDDTEISVVGTHSDARLVGDFDVTQQLVDWKSVYDPDTELIQRVWRFTPDCDAGPCGGSYVSLESAGGPGTPTPYTYSDGVYRIEIPSETQRCISLADGSLRHEQGYDAVATITITVVEADTIDLESVATGIESVNRIDYTPRPEGEREKCRQALREFVGTGKAVSELPAD